MPRRLTPRQRAASPGATSADASAPEPRLTESKRASKPAPTAVERALRLLAFRARTAQELSRALARAKVPAAESAAVLARMRELGYIDDASLADSRAKRLVAKGESPRLVARKLQQQGVAAEAAQAAARQAAEGATDDELAARALEKRLRGRPVRDERERRRLLRALVQQGHRPSSAARALKLEQDARGASGEQDEIDEIDEVDDGDGQ